MPDPTLSITRSVRHPVRAWRRFTEAVADRADAQARAAGLTVEVLPGGVRRYRDPRLDQLAAHRASQIARHCPGCGQVTAGMPLALITEGRIPAGWGPPVRVDTRRSP